MIKSRRMRWAGYVAQMGRGGMHIGYWWESQKEGGPLGRPRRRWVDNIKMDLREIGWVGIDWIEDRDRWRALVNTVMNLWVPYNAGKFFCSCTRRAQLHE
jgi:hypothetical protein